ncbi:non-specific lipid-transfer protein 1-like [Hordeum vulgare]|uniref:Non-specific lipid-transfer protein n=1 Tax=Hordeum vulgare subsp. vulgare TaxID=112509 RepID=A0A8I6WL10_HORVV|nr:non-specific lipid-transfer protein 1-like isoform X2 [Hordeum vulgare subsp. vulgare]KAE8775919.1 non-specific lipid-transfer protein 1-like [Hordeum vulgare]KAI5018973.1 hypothetical protein ZWY2020_043861 [Hordeum vulgare]
MAPALAVNRGARAAAPALLLVAALLVAARGASAALSCSTVYSRLTPCAGYAQNGGAVPQACCSGIRTLKSEARTKADIRAACACLKTLAAAAAGGPALGRAAGLPGRCGVSLPFRIDPNVNCNAI